MDKKTISGIVLIAAIMIAWMIYTNSEHQQIPPEQQQNKIENVEKNETKIDNNSIKNTEINENKNVSINEKFGTYFENFAQGNEKFINIETDYYSATVSTKGGSLVRWRLKKYNKWDGKPVQLLGYDNYELFMRFSTTDAKKIDSRELFFTVDDFQSQGVKYGIIEYQNIKLSGNQTKDVVFTIDLGNGKKLSKKITFQGDKYHINQNITVNNLDGIIKSGYSLIWANSLNFQEKNSVDESDNTKGLISMNGSVEDFDANEFEPMSQNFTGIIDYVAMKTKYFTVAIIPQPWQQFDGTANISGQAFEVKNQGKIEKYQMALQIPYKGGEQTNDFQIFIGPLEYKLVESYGLEATVELGWRFLIRPIAEYLMLPLFTAIHSFIPNYGIVLIVFGFLMKLLLYPLSIKQVRNASYMKLLTPEIEKIREKNKDNMQKQQMETMQLYSEYGLNPASGCLPLLFQMPIFMALWQTLNGAIDLRQQPFILWINDLSRPDVLLGWGFSILGLSHISGLALLMAAAMFIQQKMTITDPRQKTMIYMMPVMFLFMFSNLPSGLNLYYFIFNLLSIFQQIYINNFSHKTVTLEQLKKSPKKKEGWLAKQMRQAQEMQKATGKPLPPAMQKYIDQKQQTQNSSNKSNQNQANKRKKR